MLRATLQQLKLRSNAIPLALTLLFILLRILSPFNDIANSDEMRWHRRSEKFLVAMKEFDFKQTYQRYHPGVTLMWLNATLIQKINFYNHRVSPEVTDLTLENSAYFPTIHALSKIQLSFVLAVLFFIQLHFIYKLFGKKVSNIYGFLLVIEPYMLGIDRWFHLTSLENYLVFTSFLTLLFWRRNNNIPKYLYLSAVFYAFAILTKITAIISLPAFAFVLIYAAVLNSTDLIERIRFILNSGVRFSLIVLFTVVLFFPAIWVDPMYVFNGIFSAVDRGVTEEVRDLPTGFGASYFFYVYILIIKLSPITLGLFALSLLSFKKYIKLPEKLLILGYTLTYCLLLSLSVKKIDRYVLAMFPSILLFVSFYISQLSAFKLRLVLVSSLMFFGFVTYNLFPVYSAYYSSLLGKTPLTTAHTIGLYDNSGEYASFAALYLNTIITNESVWVPYDLDAFSPYFKRMPVRDFSSNVAYVATSISHLNDVLSYCPTIHKTFGTKTDVVYLILKCN